jgi:hypothetical protein
MSEDNKALNENKSYAEPSKGHVSLGGSIRSVLFFIPVILLFLLLLGGYHKVGDRLA